MCVAERTRPYILAQNIGRRRIKFTGDVVGTALPCHGGNILLHTAILCQVHNHLLTLTKQTPIDQCERVRVNSKTATMKIFAGLIAEIQYGAQTVLTLDYELNSAFMAVREALDGQSSAAVHIAETSVASHSTTETE